MEPNPYESPRECEDQKRPPTLWEAWLQAEIKKTHPFVRMSLIILFLVWVGCIIATLVGVAAAGSRER